MYGHQDGEEHTVLAALAASEKGVAVAVGLACFPKFVESRIA